MNCEQYNDLISARLDGELSAQEAAQLDAHLAECPRCRELLRELEEMTAAFAQEEPVQAPEVLSRGVLERIRAQRIARRRVIRRVGGFAAALVLCAGVYPMLRGASSGMAVAEADTAAPMQPARYVEQEAVADGALLDVAGKTKTTGGTAQESQIGTADEAYEYKMALPQRRLRVSDTVIRLAPTAQVLDSVDTLNEFLARFVEDDLSAVSREYDVNFFRTGRLLAVVVQEPSSSIAHEVTHVDEMQVRVSREVPPAGDSDMARWLILVEGDETLGSARGLDVELTEE